MVSFRRRILAGGVDGDLLGEVAAGHGDRDVGNVSDLRGEVRRQQVHVIGEVLPGAGDARDLGLTTELALGADLAGDAGHLAGEGVELIDHRIDGLFELRGSRHARRR